MGKQRKARLARRQLSVEQRQARAEYDAVWAELAAAGVKARITKCGEVLASPFFDRMLQVNLRKRNARNPISNQEVIAQIAGQILRDDFACDTTDVVLKILWQPPQLTIKPVPAPAAVEAAIERMRAAITAAAG